MGAGGCSGCGGWSYGKWNGISYCERCRIKALDGIASDSDNEYFSTKTVHYDDYVECDVCKRKDIHVRIEIKYKDGKEIKFCEDCREKYCKYLQDVYYDYMNDRNRSDM